MRQIRLLIAAMLAVSVRGIPTAAAGGNEIRNRGERRRRPLTVVPFVLLVLTTAFAGCGDDDAGDTTTAATAPTSVATTTTTLPPTTTTTTTLPPTTTTTTLVQNEYAGQWVGKTSQDHRISFLIGPDGGVLEFSVAFSGTQCDNASPLKVSYATPQVFVTGDVIDWLVSGIGNAEVEGQFDAPDSASGTAFLEGGSGGMCAFTLDWSASLVAP